MDEYENDGDFGDDYGGGDFGDDYGGGDFGDDYGGGDFDEEDYVQEPEMRPEMGAFDRAGGTGILGTKIDISELKGKKMEDIAKKLSRISMGPEERLQIYVDALSRKFDDDGVVGISNENIDEMLSFISSLKKPQYINPVGFIMGYVATQGGRSMIKESVRKTIGVVEKLKGEGGMTGPDTLRYSTLWINLRRG